MSGDTSGLSAPMPIEVISFSGTPRATSSLAMTAARRPLSSLLCYALPLESVCPETSNLKLLTPALLRFFFALINAFAKFLSF